LNILRGSFATRAEPVKFNAAAHDGKLPFHIRGKFMRTDSRYVKDPLTDNADEMVMFAGLRIIAFFIWIDRKFENPSGPFQSSQGSVHGSE
jgi:hypothetical protein